MVANDFFDFRFTLEVGGRKDMKFSFIVRNREGFPRKTMIPFTISLKNKKFCRKNTKFLRFDNVPFLEGEYI